MATEGAENFSVVVSAIAASAAVFVGWLGLNTWQTQIRWQQGRGLAVNLLQSLRVVRLQASRSFELVTPNYDERSPIEERRSLLEAVASRTDEYLVDLRKNLDDFERLSSEAMVVWGESFETILMDLRDIEHDLRGVLMSGVAALNPDVPAFQRNQNSRTAHEIWDEIRNPRDESRNFSKKLIGIQAELEQRLTAKKLR